MRVIFDIHEMDDRFESVMINLGFVWAKHRPPGTTVWDLREDLNSADVDANDITRVARELKTNLEIRFD